LQRQRLVCIGQAVLVFAANEPSRSQRFSEKTCITRKHSCTSLDDLYHGDSSIRFFLLLTSLSLLSSQSFVLAKTRIFFPIWELVNYLSKASELLKRSSLAALGASTAPEASRLDSIRAIC